MCQEALSDLKIAIRAAGEHKQRIQVHVAIDGLRLRDDKTGVSLVNKPVNHQINYYLLLIPFFLLLFFETGF